MKKIALILVISMLAAFAHAEDKCFSVVAKKFEAESQGDVGGFEGLFSITQSDAQADMDTALWDMNSVEHLAMAKELSKEDGKLFYGMSWTAPSNSGYSVIIVDANTCEVLADVGITSEE